jgi:hypothetical protein
LNNKRTFEQEIGGFGGMQVKIQTGLYEVNYRLISFDKTTELQMDSCNVAATLKRGRKWLFIK